MPIRIIQSNERAAEVQYICDHCGKPFKTSVVSRKEVDQQKKQTSILLAMQTSKNKK